MKRLHVDYDYLFHTVPGNYLVMLNDPPKYTIVEANQALLDLVGMKREQLMEHSLWEVFPESENEASQRGTRRLHESIEECLRTGRPHSVGVIRYDLPLENSSFERRLWATTNFPIIHDGKISGIILSTENVTKRYDDDALTKAHIAQLTEITQAQDEFISIASHQLRTPATGVKQYLGMLREGLFGEIPDNQREILDRAYESNERQLRIVTDLLKVAQVDSGKITLHKELTDINELLHNVVRDNLAMFKKRDQMFTFKPSNNKVFVHIDGETIRTVVENLLENASKYTEQGGKIAITIQSLGDNIHIRIIDEGVGVAPDRHDDLFKKFSRINNPLSTIVGGTGLGLYWARQSLDAHGGSITYRPNQPRGSIFEIILPKDDGLSVKIVTDKKKTNQ